ncbi:MAG: hypothetical protein LBD59_01395 [Prevotellaceae bacterium]|nr:hypothetical protein [Prevotellaceae bacterium]
MENLPMGISRTISNVEYTVAISGIVNKGSYADLTVYGRIRTSHDTMFFGAQGIKFSYGGDFVGDVKLMLLADMTMPLWGGAELILHGGFDKESGRGVEKTYLTMGCEGFRELNIVADLVFSENFIRKVDAGNKPVLGKEGRVSCAIKTTVKDWSDILLAINLPRFAINGLDDFTFGLKDVVFDFSDSQNHPSTRFPNNYESKYLIPGQSETWKGVFAGRIEVILPPQFSKRDSITPVSFSANNLLIDNNGVSGLIEGHNILPFNQGSAGGWNFSVNSFFMTMEANDLTGAGFAGSIGLPVSDTAKLDYAAIITPGNEYLLRVTPSNSFVFDFWSATVEIQKNSYVELKVIDGKFRPSATLHGSMSIRAGNANSNKALAELKDIKFTGLHLQTVSPYFSVQSMGYGGEVKLGAFPLSISNIEVKTDGNEAKLGFNAKLMLAGDKTPINAETRLEILGAMTDNRWKYKGVNVSEVALNAKIASAFELEGRLQIMNNDQTYGDGFMGDIKLQVNKGINLTVATRVIFGNVNFRYWLVDGYIELPVGIPIASALVLNGFGGGAYNRMRPEGQSALPTGVKYVPDEKYGLGFKASVMFRSAGSKSLLQGSAMFEIAFNKNGGVNFIGFYGEAKLLGEIPGISKMDKFVNDKFNASMGKEVEFLKNKTPSELEKLKNNKPNEAAGAVHAQTEKPGTAGLLAVAGIKFDFENNSFHSNFDLYINAAGGLIRGVGDNNRAGSVVLHIDPQKWYLHVGTPTNRVGLEFNLVNIVKVKTGAYFMAGHEIPGSPPPPQEVADILRRELSQLDYMRDLNALGDGKGLTFGSNMSVSTGDITFLILYANFKAGFGFDIMLKNYNRPCVETGKVPGIDGWYANGQAYAYLQGELGVKVNLWFVKKKIPIIKGATATLIQAKLPNPAWFAGYLGVSFDLLGGLVKGNMQFKLSLGEECTLLPADGAPLDIKEIISEMTPADKSTEVDVFSVPQVAFNMPIGKTFELNDDLGNKRRYRLNLVGFTVFDKTNVPVKGKNSWNSEKDRLSFTSHDILPPHTELKAKVSISFEEYVNNVWKTVTEEGKTAEESMETAFSTGDAPTSIPENNIQYCYPVLNQQYYYTGETNESYVQLKRGQAYLFTSDMRHEIKLTKGSDRKTITFVYDADKNCLKYAMPQLDKKSKYKMEVLSYTNTTATAATEVGDRRNTVLSDEANEVSLRNAQAIDAVRDDDAGVSRLAYEFSTSSYELFKDKLNGVKKTNPSVWRDDSENYYYLKYLINGGEAFSVEELSGTSYTEDKPLIERKAILNDPYYKEDIYPLVYKNYPVNLFTSVIVLKNREVSEAGVPPQKGIGVLTEYLTEVDNGILNNVASRLFPYRYDLVRYYQRDFYDLRLQLANKLISNSQLTKQYEYIIGGYFPKIRKGTYEVEFRYVFPNGNAGSSGIFEFYNSL